MSAFDESVLALEEEAMLTPMHQILPPSRRVDDTEVSTGALYLGSLTAVFEVELLHQHKITHIVHVLDTLWWKSPSSEESDGFICYHVNLLDQRTADLRPHLEPACAYIDGVLRSGENVLVHCQMGVSRSASIVIAYLIRSHGMSFDNAFALVKDKRRCIKPNPGFLHALKEWEASHSQLPSTQRQRKSDEN